ncbi:MAG: GH92 family glycosyl hydrolase [Ignavibacteriales bacterium]|nr:GH92 family glycosyl hydrolase [Ignavibacteriales bacterium]
MTIKSAFLLRSSLGRTIVLALLAIIAVRAIAQERQDGLKYIDMTIGNVGHLLEPTRPTVHLPNQMMRFHPDRRDHLDDQISCFPLAVISHRIAKAFNIKPAVGASDESAWNARMTWDHNLEISRPWYYATDLIEMGVKAEYAPGARSAMFRFTFPRTAKKHLLFGHYYKGGTLQANGQEITGVEVFKNVTTYLYGRVSTMPGVEGSGERLRLTFSEESPSVLEFRYAVSFVSMEQARINFDREVQGVTFAELCSGGESAWSKVINQIKVNGGTEAWKRSFYTALYRCYERPVNISESESYFSGFDNKIHVDARPFYVDDWTWDTYLAHHPLRMILHPTMEADMLQSYVRMYQQSGWMPTFPVIYGDHACMNGFHSSIMFLDAYRKGIRNYSVDSAFAGMLKNGDHATMVPWRNGPRCELDEFYAARGFFPALHPGEKESYTLVDSFEKRQAVAVTLGHSYDDWAVAEMATELGRGDVAERYRPRSRNYLNLWNPDKKMFMPKDSLGKWINIDPKFDGGPGGRDYYDENNGWTYLWQTQHDIPGLTNLLGGKSGLEAKLDQLFREGLGRSKYSYWAVFPDATALVGQFSMGNEPSFHIPYLFNFTDSPWKTQKWTRLLLETWFNDSIFGIPGDEDGGGMSAFVVFSAMGFYPVTPGIPAYTITSPQFADVTIRLENGREFRVVAHNNLPTCKYIQSAKLNGAKLDKLFFSHEELMKGGLLELEMGPLPVLQAQK